MDYSPSMVNGKIVRLSVSQISRFDIREHGGCKRKWWFKYIGKIPDPDAQYFKDGKDGHKRFEDHYSGGKEVVWLLMDLPALKLLPAPGPGVLPESQLANLSLLRIPFQGAMDLVHERDVYDYKFQSKIRVYPQPTAQLWGYLEELRLRDNSGGRLGFHYIHIEKPPKDPVKALTWKPKARKVSMGPSGPEPENGRHFEPREVERRWQTYGSLVKEMQETAAEPDVSKVEANREACFAFGPCPYIGICPKNEEHFMGFMEELAALKRQDAAVVLPEVQAEIKALPPDAPPPDAVPTAPETPPVEPKKTRAKKEKPPPPVLDDNEIPDSSPTYAPKPTPNPAIKLVGLRLGLTMGLPNYSSAAVTAEMTGGTEEEMTRSIEALIMRGLKRQTEAFIEASKMQAKALREALAKVEAAIK